jgi:tRNA modification GTPase
VSETVVALLTPPGKSALATLGVAGPLAWEVVRGLFSPRSGKPLPEAPQPGRWWLGRAGDDLADDAVLAVRRGEPIPLVELHVHGGREVSRYLADLLVERGLRLVSWDDFLRRDEADPLRGAAAVALAQATTTRTAGILLDQYHGALRRELDRARAALAGGDAAAARGLLAELAGRADVGRHLTAPFRVVVAGAPNVGKSSLVNALTGYQRSVVSPQPGTTRDVVTTALAIDGWPVELADTAGLRAGGESLEEAGIEQARLAATAADLVLWLVDASAEPAWPAANSPHLHVIVNKIDLPAAWDLTRAGGAPRVSAATGEGLGELVAALGRWLVPEAPPPGAAVPFTPDLIAAVGEALARLDAGDAAGALARLTVPG